MTAAMPSPTAALPKQVGRYRILGQLGVGVYRAEHPDGRIVAVKVGNAADSADQQWRRERILREAAHLRSLSHPNIVTFYGIEEGAAGQAYIVMECVEAKTLEEILAAGELLPAVSLLILRQTAAALDYTHARGMIHRDVKPLNILVASGDKVKVVDFERATSAGLTSSAGLTPNYASPEQIQEYTKAFRVPVYVLCYQPSRVRIPDGRSDQYSLAAIAYRMLVGRPPFQLVGKPPYTAWDILRLFQRILDDAPDPPNQLNPTLPPGAVAALTKALAKYPEDRYRTCGEFVEALAAAL